jgi:hypothetical protein
MEPHPPLGKLLIAAGEALIDANPTDDQFIATDHAKNLPENFSFKGYRLLPVLLSAAACPLFYLFLLRLSGNPVVAFVFALMLPLDNALVVHMRGAMLDGIQIFFVLGSLTATAAAYRRAQTGKPLGLAPIIIGLSLGAALTTKATSLIAIPFIAIILPAALRFTRELAIASAQVIVSAALVFIAVWGTHIKLGAKVQPTLPDRGFYQASAETKQLLNSGEQAKLSSFPTVLRDHLNFFPHYQRGVPKPNMCNLNETGSPPFLWPLGGRTINYRWDRKDDKVRYTYLVPNPFVWGIGLVGLITALAFLISAALGGYKIDRDWRVFASALAVMWVGYMGIMIALDRVMYLYHYFLPLIFTLALAAITLARVTPTLPWGLKLNRSLAALALILATITGFRLYAPFTYGYPITNAQLSKLALLGIWDLRCPDCELTNTIAKPTCNPKEYRFPQIKIGALSAADAYQDWGEPIQGLSVERKPITVNGASFERAIGTHASSTIRFPINKLFSAISGKVALPDYVRDKDGTTASVIFQLWLDGIQIWGSKRITPADPIQDFSVPVANGTSLELRVTDAGDGNNNDHAVWLDVKLD